MAKEPQSRLASACTLIRNLLLAGFLYSAIFGVISLARKPGTVKGKLGIPAFLEKSGPADIIKTTSKGVKVKFAASSSLVTINPHANVFNRPKSAVVPRDDYLGPRPHVDTEADLQMLVEECRGTYEGLERMRNVFDCLRFLDQGQDKYHYLPAEKDRASNQSPRDAEYNDADGHGNTKAVYVDVASAKNATKTSRGECPGPIIPYHTYWTGPATWRLEIFVKSYLYTQNLPCSRLYIWIDEDRKPDGVEKMLTKDPLFARFLPFIDRGDIVLKSWKFPNRIPLPKTEDNTDGNGYYKNRGKPNLQGEVVVADGIVEDSSGQHWLALTPKQMTFLPQAVSDAVRFVVLHLYGGAYFDMDVLMLRDMRPLLLPKHHSFAERWAAHPHPGDYNTAILSLTANSSLSSYLLRGGVRMGLNFHPRVIGRMAWKDGRDKELLMLETAAFDPIWTEFNWDREGRCTVPCLKDYSAVFKGGASALKDEWESYDGAQLPFADQTAPKSTASTETSPVDEQRKLSRREQDPSDPHAPVSSPEPESTDSFHATSAEEAELRNAGVIAEYRLDQDKYPPNNRTLENFFRGAWTYHIHNQWLRHPEPSSWLSVIEHAHDGFFAGTRPNMYGEFWNGPSLMPYNHWPEYV
ncbi:uncharacterized protein PV09_04702 [Verruconis gallopava]|uniref:Snorna binding protein n=1 Tax=Verruconis gallopava TaxID=253628 RepID=A0A0D1YUT9_9PEZI|nr:uncharacterized protein PV09_04702 [Verruconis gallopava]KIW04432.1 hypothetical protein PV09_04702 [Verruconis gallopava]